MRSGLSAVTENFLIGWKGFSRSPFSFIFLVIIALVANVIAMFILSRIPFEIAFILKIMVSAYFILLLSKAANTALTGTFIISKEFFKVEIALYIKFIIVSAIFSIGVLISALETFLMVPITLVIVAFFLPLPFIMIETHLSINITNRKSPIQWILVTVSCIVTIVKAIIKSYKLTIPHIMFLLVFTVLSFIATTLAGLLTLGLGIFVAIPVIIIASAQVYKKLDQDFNDKSNIVETVIVE